MAQLTGYAQTFDAESTKVYDSTTENVPYKVGTKALDVDGNEYVFVKGVGSMAIGSVLTFDPSAGYATALIVANAVGEVAVAVSAIDATSKYGFVMTKGVTPALTGNTVVDNKPAYISGSGVIDDAGVAGDLVIGMIIREARTGAGLANVSLNNPVVLDGAYLV